MTPMYKLLARCWNQIPEQKQLKGGKFYLARHFQGLSVHHGEGGR